MKIAVLPYYVLFSVYKCVFLLRLTEIYYYVMPKISPKYRLEAYEDDTLVSSNLMETNKAMDKMVFWIECAIKMRFNNINRFRLYSGNHLLFEFRDVRKIIDQKEFML